MLITLYPKFLLFFSVVCLYNSPNILPASKPAFSTIVLVGFSSASINILAPVASSPSRFIDSTASFALKKATPPPGTIPSSTAAFVAFTASSTLSFFSFISPSVAAPTLITATPPVSFATLS